MLAKIHRQRLMRIVTAGTVFQGKMPPDRLGVATVAALAQQLPVRLMFWMTAGATRQFGMMSKPLFREGDSLLLVTGDTELSGDFN